MRTVGLTFHEETQSAPAVEAGASLPEQAHRNSIIAADNNPIITLFILVSFLTKEP